MICLILAEFDVCPLLKLRLSRFLPLTDNYLHNSDSLSEYTERTQLVLAGTREERRRYHLVSSRIRCSA
jgi:hypothetical protein